MAPPARGAGGIPTSPLCPPGPPIPPSNGRGIPPDPPCTGRGTPPCLSADRGRIGPAHLAWFWARNQPGAGAGTHPAWPRCRGACSLQGGPTAAAPCRHSKDRPASEEPGEGSAAPKATVALPGTDVNPAGRAPARLAVHCCLATGGPGAAMRHAPFGRPRRPLGTFPRGESTSSARRRAKPPTRDRFLVVARERAFLSFFVSQRISPLRRRPKGFPVALWKPSGPLQ